MMSLVVENRGENAKL